MEQHVSTEVSTRQEVAALQAALEEKLVERQARKEGLCPIRQELFSELADELIRQIAVNSPERGILLLRVRDELRMTISAYQTLYESSVLFGTRKQLEAQENRVDGSAELAALAERRAVAEEEIEGLRLSLETHSRRQVERDAVLAKRRGEELDFLQHQHSHLETFLKSIEKQAAAQAANN